MRLRPYPNGATAMRALAGARRTSPIGCTQVTEILNTPGVALVGPLPKQFELATVYTAGVQRARPCRTRRGGWRRCSAARPHALCVSGSALKRADGCMGSTL